MSATKSKNQRTSSSVKPITRKNARNASRAIKPKKTLLKTTVSKRKTSKKKDEKTALPAERIPEVIVTRSMLKRCKHHQICTVDVKELEDKLKATAIKSRLKRKPLSQRKVSMRWTRPLTECNVRKQPLITRSQSRQDLLSRKFLDEERDYVTRNLNSHLHDVRSFQQSRARRRSEMPEEKEEHTEATDDHGYRRDRSRSPFAFVRTPSERNLQTSDEDFSNPFQLEEQEVGQSNCRVHNIPSHPVISRERKLLLKKRLTNSLLGRNRRQRKDTIRQSCPVNGVPSSDTALQTNDDSTLIPSYQMDNDLAMNQRAEPIGSSRMTADDQLLKNVTFDDKKQVDFSEFRTEKNNRQRIRDGSGNEAFPERSETFDDGDYMIEGDSQIDNTKQLNHKDCSQANISNYKEPARNQLNCNLQEKPPNSSGDDYKMNPLQYYCKEKRHLNPLSPPLYRTAGSHGGSDLYGHEGKKKDLSLDCIAGTQIPGKQDRHRALVRKSKFRSIGFEFRNESRENPEDPSGNDGRRVGKQPKRRHSWRNLADKSNKCFQDPFLEGAMRASEKEQVSNQHTSNSLRREEGKCRTEDSATTFGDVLNDKTHSNPFNQWAQEKASENNNTFYAGFTKVVKSATDLIKAYAVKSLSSLQMETSSLHIEDVENKDFSSKISKSSFDGQQSKFEASTVQEKVSRTSVFSNWLSSRKKRDMPEVLMSAHYLHEEVSRCDLSYMSSGCGNLTQPIVAHATPDINSTLTDVNSTVTDVNPHVADVFPIVTQTTPTVTDTTPTVADVTPYVANVFPIIRQTTPTVTDTTATVTDTTPNVTGATSGVINVTSTVTDATPIVIDATSIVKDATSLVTDVIPTVTDFAALNYNFRDLIDVKKPSGVPEERLRDRQETCFNSTPSHSNFASSSMTNTVSSTSSTKNVIFSEVKTDQETAVIKQFHEEMHGYVRSSHFQISENIGHSGEPKIYADILKNKHPETLEGQITAVAGENSSTVKTSKSYAVRSRNFALDKKNVKAKTNPKKTKQTNRKGMSFEDDGVCRIQ